MVRRLERYRLQSVARVLVPGERVSSCLRRIVPGEKAVKVWRTEERAHYSGLMVCGSVWVCPVCAAKITERRRLDLVAGLDAWKARGGEVLMLTLTVPHYAHQPLKTVLSAFEKARGLLRNRKTWRGVAARVDVKGTVRALEVTHGANGWHVHCHELLFLSDGREESLRSIEGELASAWRSACLSAGLDAPNGHGLRLHDGSQAARYAGKWGLDQELTKGHIKRGRDGNLSPWDFLREVLETGEDEKGELFREYAKAFKGHRQLHWSRGLRSLLGLDEEKTDKELAEKLETGSVLLGSLSWQDWHLVLGKDKRGQLLEIAGKQGWEGVLRFVSVLRKGGPHVFS